jgi:preprotein translocase subunit SecE
VDTVKTWVSTGADFLREVGVELRKVTWPTRQETLGSTMVVLVMAILMAIFFWGVDILLTLAVRQVL